MRSSYLFQFVNVKKKNKETNCYFLSFTHETTETISPNFLTRVESINKMEEAQEKKKISANVSSYRGHKWT